MANRQVITARLILDSPVEGQDRAKGYVVSALKNSCKNIRDGTVLTTVYDDEEHIIGVDLSGTPSEELQDELEDLLDKLESPVVKVTPRPPPNHQQNTG